MIRRLEVKGLNNQLNADMEFNEDLNIITGRNGSGKTTLLKLIWYIISGNLIEVISEIPFQTVIINTDLFSLSLARVDGRRCHLSFWPTGQGKMSVNFDFPLLPTSRSTFESIDNVNQKIVNIMTGSLFFPSFRRIEGGFSRFSGPTSASDSMNYYTQPLGWKSVEEPMESLQTAMSGVSGAMSVCDHKFIASISTHDIVELLKEKYTDVSEKTNNLCAKLSNEIMQEIDQMRLLVDTSPGLDGIEERINHVNVERDSLLKPFFRVE